MNGQLAKRLTPACADVAGQEVRHDFEPFGEEVGGPTTTERRLFTSAERDFESGFDDLGARF